jgi:hypothetical protein
VTGASNITGRTPCIRDFTPGVARIARKLRVFFCKKRLWGHWTHNFRKHSFFFRINCRDTVATIVQTLSDQSLQRRNCERSKTPVSLLNGIFPLSLIPSLSYHQNAIPAESYVTKMSQTTGLFQALFLRGKTGPLGPYVALLLKKNSLSYLSH